ncbi:MAG: hypothetical protein NTW95_06720 [Candidatus Aminicenantes bacterium]|nr:hypothetical protein [Candidatus Aminicenantes bacterium]
MKKNGPDRARTAAVLMLFFLAIAATAGTDTVPPVPAASCRAGLRSSPYGPRHGFPAPAYWLAAARSMASAFTRAAPVLVWIVGTMERAPAASEEKGYSGRVLLSFPAPAGGAACANIVFAPRDVNEAYLEQFDRNGFQVWLQVEPGNADVDTLIRLALGRYARHPCVIGFGVDVEWHCWSRQNSAGIKITDAQAEAWSQSVRSFNPRYQLFLKHWLAARMPPTYRRGLVFINDSQRFASFAQMLKHFEQWGKNFAPAPVGFQFGYPADRGWWQRLANPAQDIGKALLSRLPNASDLIWVDFTMEEIWSPAICQTDPVCAILSPQGAK